MEEWEDIDSAVSQRKIEDSIDSYWDLSRPRAVVYGKIEAKNTKPKTAKDQQAQELVSPFNFEQPPPITTGGWNSSDSPGVQPYPANDDNFDIVLGVGDSQEIMRVDESLGNDGGDEVEFPRGIKDYQTLLWNHSKRRWEAAELELNISGAKIQLKAVGTGITGNGVITEITVPDCED
jgi:hypothetical protein